MKKFVSMFLMLVILLSSAKYSFAEDSFSVQHTVIKANEGILSINIAVPYFEGFKNSDEINRQIRNIVADFIGEIRAVSKSLEEYKNELIESGEEPFDWETTLLINYDYSRNGDILSVKLDVYSYLGGAHGMSYIYPITMNTKTGEIYTFKDLFKENTNSDENITNRILKEIEKNPDMYFEDYKETIIDKDGQYNYYIDGDKLVIYFDLYDIAPYAAGMPTFTIDAGEIKALLKDEVYNSIKDGKVRGIISYNGADINSNSKIIYDDQYTPLVPLRVIAETLGYTVDWNRKDGAIVNGNIVKDGTVVDGVTYVPIQYFTQVLEENVVFETSSNDKLLIKLYSKTGEENGFNNQIFKFELPMTAEDAVNMYAEAVKMRNGAIQYGLLSDELRDEKYNEFKELGFVTGTSSPWVDSYEIENIGDNSFKIIFNLRTSVPTDSITSTVKVKLIQDGEYWRISSIEKI